MQPARSPCSMRAHARSAWRGTITRSWCSRASMRARSDRTRCISTRRACGRRTMTPGLRLPSTRASTSGARGWSSAPAASAIPNARPLRSRRRSIGSGSASTRSGHSPAGCNPGRRNGPIASCCSAIRSTPTRRPRRRAPLSARVATPACRPASRSPISRSTRSSTARHGAIPTSAGCSPLCRAR